VAASFSKVIAVGNLTRDPDIKTLPSGTQVCEISLAINDSYKGKDGNKVESVTYLECSFFGVVCGIFEKYTSKGSSVLIEGKLRTETWTDKATGQNRSKLKVIGETMQLLGSRTESHKTPRAAVESAPAMESVAAGVTPDEVPF
jgi:single-strand DNA-binding protein